MQPKKLDAPPFVLNVQEEERIKTFTVRVTDDLKEWFVDAKKTIRQPKNGTAIKQLAYIGYMQVLHDEKIKAILDTVTHNSKLNIISGVTEKEYEI